MSFAPARSLLSRRNLTAGFRPAAQGTIDFCISKDTRHPDGETLQAHDAAITGTPEGLIFSRKLKGIHTRRHSMLNGAVRYLDHAFCLSGSRGTTPPVFDGLRDDVHLDLCTDYERDDKIALKAFLEAWH